MKPYAVLASLLLAGCVTSSQVTDSDFLDQVLPVDHDTALKNLMEGWRRCQDSIFGYPTYVQFKDHTVIDIYGVTPYMKDRSNYVAGRVELWMLPNGTKIRSGIPIDYVNRQRRQNWIQWAQGNYQCDW